AAGAIERVRLVHLGRWSERVLDWTMSHPGFKTELFRFVDVFPACRDDADVLRHLSEYFAGVDVPRALGLGLEVAERVPFGARLSTAAARRNIMRMARQLIAGATPEDALPRLAALWRAGEACTVDLLGEKTVTEREAARYAGRVRAPLELLRPLGAEFPAGPPLGCVIQAYRKDAFADLREVVAWSERALRLPLAVRLVKGAYWDFETVVATAEGWPVPVFEAKAETDA